SRPSTAPCFVCLPFYCVPPHRHSFPTRRSSDLPSTRCASRSPSSTRRWVQAPVSTSSWPTPAASPSRSPAPARASPPAQETVKRSEEHTSELQSRENLVCRLLLEKKKQNSKDTR